ncbi:MAG: hypothetical protein ABSA02_32940, partial [Trebonia sp.]
MDQEDRGPGQAETVSQGVRLGGTAGAGTTRTGAGQVASVAERIAELRGRLISPMPDDRLWGWIWPLLITA